MSAGKGLLDKVGGTVSSTGRSDIAADGLRSFVHPATGECVG